MSAVGLPFCRRFVRPTPECRYGSNLIGRAVAGAGAEPLAEGGFVEAPEFARMELAAFVLQDAQSLDADAQMLADCPLIKRIGLSRQLDLAVERLVGDA